MISRLGLVIYMVVLLANTAYAAPFADVYDQQQTAKRQEQEQKDRVEQPFSGTQTVVNFNNAQWPDDTHGFKINEYIINDGGKGFQWLRKELQPYENRRIGVNRLRFIVEKLQKAVKDEGYVTTIVTVPAQDLNSKKLEIKVVPGYIEEIGFKDNKKMGIWRNAFPCKKGDILNIFDLDQGLDQMRRVPNQNVRLDLVPGSESGQTKVLIDVERSKVWAAGLTVDDSGQKSTGRYQGTSYLSLYNPTGLNDVFNISYTHDVEGRSRLGSKNNSFSYFVPYKNYSFNVNHYYNEYDQLVPSVVPYTHKGKNDTWEFGMQRLLHRDTMRKTQLSAKLIHRHKQGYLNGEELKVQELQTTAYQIGLMHRQYAGKGVFDTMVYFQKGVPILHAQSGLDDFNPDYMTTRYSLWGFNLYYGTPFKLLGVDSKYNLTARGQFTSDMLYSADQFAIGGRYTVRGFSGENTLSAENGFVIRNEFSFPLRNVKVEPYIGIDYGRVWGPSDEFNLGSQLAGAYLGLRGKAGIFNYDGFVGIPVYKPQGFKADKHTCGFSVYMNF